MQQVVWPLKWSFRVLTTYFIAALILFPLSALAAESAQDITREHREVMNWLDDCTRTNHRELTPEEKHVFRLSYELNESRLENGKLAQSASNRLRIAAIVTIVFGFISTVLIGINNSDLVTGSRWKLALKVASFMAPAFGTMLAAFVALYKPQDESEKYSRIQTGLDNLHIGIRLAVSHIDCVVKDGLPDTKAAEQLATAYQLWFATYDRTIKDEAGADNPARPTTK